VRINYRTCIASTVIAEFVFTYLIDGVQHEQQSLAVGIYFSTRILLTRRCEHGSNTIHYARSLLNNITCKCTGTTIFTMACFILFQLNLI
jgi:hypothetical protein